MALDGTYAGLKASVAGWLDRTDLTSQIPDFITLAESQMNAVLRHKSMLVRSTATINDQFEVSPSDFAGPYVMRLLNSTPTPNHPLDWIDPGELFELGGYYDRESGVPTSYSVVDGSFAFSPSPSASFTAELIYYANLPSLAANDTNWLLKLKPDAYLYGALTHAAPFLIEDARASTWVSLFQTAVNDLNTSSVRQSMGARMQVGNPFAP